MRCSIPASHPKGYPMQHLASDLIAAARTLVDDDHEDDDSFIDPDRWLQFLNWELTELYWRLVRMGAVQPALTEATFAGPNTTISARAVHSVGRDYGSYVQPLRNNQSLTGHHAIWVPSSAPTSDATEWFVTGDGDSLTVQLYPRSTASHKVRYVAPLAYLTAASQSTPDIPAGVESRIVYGMARHAGVKEASRSSAIAEGIVLAEANIGHLATQRRMGDGPRVINSRKRRTFYQPPTGLVFP